MEIKMNENHEICARCGGKCCMSYGCHLHPDDFIKRFGPITRESIIAALECGDYSVDAWNGDVREDEFPEIAKDIPETELKFESWFFRTRHIGYEVIDNYSSGGVCVNFTKHGCKFSWEDRPSGGRALIPVEGSECEQTSFDKPDAVLAWLPYSDLIEKVIYSPEFIDRWSNYMTWIEFSAKLREEGKRLIDVIPD